LKNRSKSNRQYENEIFINEDKNKSRNHSYLIESFASPVHVRLIDACKAGISPTGNQGNFSNKLVAKDLFGAIPLFLA
jgi:hypothetical protein